MIHSEIKWFVCVFFVAGLGSFWSNDSALHRHPAAPLVLQQEEIRLSQKQEELKEKFTVKALKRRSWIGAEMFVFFCFF